MRSQYQISSCMPDAEIKLTPAQYAELQNKMARLAAAVMVFPSDVVLRAVRILRSFCTEIEKDAQAGATVDEVALKHCAEMAAKHRFIEECAIGMTAARIKIENAMEAYQKAGGEVPEETKKKSALWVPK
jgi:hypothetical protein